MKPEFINGNIRANCPSCDGAVSTYEYKESGSKEYGYVIRDERHHFKGKLYSRIIFRIFRCAGCGSGGIGKIHIGHDSGIGGLEWFYPKSIEREKLPSGIPAGIQSEFREAEDCCANGSLRAASAMFRSVLEKTLRANGYIKGNLYDRIDELETVPVLKVPGF